MPPAFALPASLREMPHGGAIVTIGTIASPYANAATAWAELVAMERRGVVTIQREPEGKAC